MREYRLFTILYHLLNRPRSTTKELALLCEVSQRTILRDLDVMTLHNIPVYAKRGRTGGVYLDTSYVLERQLFTPNERSDILLALSFIESLLSEHSTKLIQKVQSLMGEETNNLMAIDLSRWGQTTVETQQLLQMKEAISQKRYLTFVYQNANGKQSDRLVKPLKLVYKNYHWYLQAYCCSRKMVRTFKLSRMSNSQVLTQHFPETYQLTKIDQIEPSKDTELIIQLEAECQERLRDAFNDCQFYEEKGKCCARVSVKKDRWLYAHLLSFGHSIQIISPLEVKEEIRHRILNLYKLYF